jgi:short-subunit dehydrogenase
MALDLTGRSVFITGAGSGIGKATALRFAAAGSRLFLVGRTESKLVEVQKEILEKHPNVEVVLSTVDLNDKKAVDTAVQSAVDKFGGLSVVVANGM